GAGLDDADGRVGNQHAAGERPGLAVADEQLQVGATEDAGAERDVALDADRADVEVGADDRDGERAALRRAEDNREVLAADRHRAVDRAARGVDADDDAAAGGEPGAVGGRGAGEIAGDAGAGDQERALAVVDGGGARAADPDLQAAHRD